MQLNGQLEDLLCMLREAKTLDDLHGFVEAVRDYYAIRHVVYHWVNADGERFAVLTYSSGWIDRYLDQDYLGIDPVIHGCFQSFTAVNWKDLDWSSKSARAMLEDALSHGVGNQGFTTPIRGPNGQFALFTVNDCAEDADWQRFIQEHARDLVIVAHELNKKVLEMEGWETANVSNSLTPRELAVMRCLARGMSRGQAATQLGISEHTLRVYVEAARHKLGALNTTHAVARALSIGAIVI